MPLLTVCRPFSDAVFGVWLIAEEESFFSDKIELSAGERRELEEYRLGSRRRLEWWAARYLLHLLSAAPRRLPVAKDAFSKPFFVEKNGLRCSLSHSGGVVGALLAPVNCGCDVQICAPRTLRLAPRFLNADEVAALDAADADARADLAHAYWTAKESLYKLWGHKGLDFRRDMRVRDPSMGEEFWGEVTSAGRILRARLTTQKLVLPDDRVLMCAACLEAKPDAR